MTWRLDQDDALHWLGSWPDFSVDAVVTDPAYASLDRHRAPGTTKRLSRTGVGDGAGWFPTIANSMYSDMAREWARVLKPSGVLVLFGDDETTLDVAVPALTDAGWQARGSGSKTFRRTVIWDKCAIGMGYGVRRQHEHVLVWQRPRPRPWKTNPDYNGGFGSIQSFPRVVGGYPTQKPVELLSALVKQFTWPGDMIVDCFAGSGSTGVAAIMAGRQFAGCDVSEASVAVARMRLALALDPGPEDPQLQLL